jgi:hypothetical protein
MPAEQLATIRPAGRIVALKPSPPSPPHHAMPQIVKARGISSATLHRHLGLGDEQDQAA